MFPPQEHIYAAHLQPISTSSILSPRDSDAQLLTLPCIHLQSHAFASKHLLNITFLHHRRTAAVQCRRSSLLSSNPKFTFPARSQTSTASSWPRSNDRMAVSTHMGGAVAELDLSASCGPNTIVDRINAMPALKTSAGESIFFVSIFFVPRLVCSYRPVYSEPCLGNWGCDVDDATSLVEVRQSASRGSTFIPRGIVGLWQFRCNAWS